MNLVSILVPTYNAEKYLERCARSIFSQTYDNLDIVFVDDGSKDCSINVLRRTMEDFPRRKEQVRIIQHSYNRGSSAARNTAIDNAKGEFVTFVDADDFLTKDAIELLVSKQQDTDADIINGQVIQITKKYHVIMERPSFLHKVDFIKDMTEISFHHTLWGRLIRKSLYTENDIKAMEGVDVGEDMQVMVQLAYFAHKIESLWNVVYYYDTTNVQSYMNTYGKNQIKKLRADIDSMEIVRNFLIDKEQECLRQVEKNLYSQYISLLDCLGGEVSNDDFYFIKNQVMLLSPENREMPFKKRFMFLSYYIFKIIKKLR